jgi:hypothetical protein
MRERAVAGLSRLPDQRYFPGDLTDAPAHEATHGPANYQVLDWRGRQPGDGGDGLMGRQITRLSSVAVLAAGMLSCSPAREQQAGAPAGTTTLDVRALDADGDSKILFRGRVVENVRGCEVDVACYLRVAVDGLQTTVVYHSGEWPPCGNSAAIRQGEAVRKGELIEVNAGIVDGDKLTTCTSSEFYIRRISGP